MTAGIASSRLANRHGCHLIRPLFRHLIHVRAMYEWRGDKPRPDFNQALADTYVGKYILVGITYLDHTGKELRRQQLHGVIESATPNGINISLRGTRSGQSWNMPPMLDSIS